MPTELELMRLQAATLYLRDDDGRLLAVNEAGRPPAPRVFLGRTPSGNVWCLRDDISGRLASQLADLLAAEPTAEDLTVEPRCLPAVRAALAEHRPVEREWRGPAYLIPPGAGGSVDAPAVDLTPGQADLLGPSFEWLLAPLRRREPCVAVVEDGRAVAVCFCSRLGTRAAEAGLETLPEHRRRGFGSAAAAAWAVAVRRRRLLPLYSTSWDNLASRGVAARLGARLYGEDVWLR